MAMSEFSDQKLFSRDTLRWAAAFFGSGLIALLSGLMTLYLLALIQDFLHEWGMPWLADGLARITGAIALTIVPFYWCLLGTKMYSSSAAAKAARYVVIFTMLWFVLSVALDVVQS
jgi:hypothetical protein